MDRPRPSAAVRATSATAAEVTTTLIRATSDTPLVQQNMLANKQIDLSSEEVNMEN